MSITSQQFIADKVAKTFEGMHVRKLPLNGPDNMETPHFGLFLERDGTLESLPSANTVKEGYVPHTTQDVVDLTRAAAYGFDCPVEELQVDATWGGRGHRVMVMPSMSRRRAVYGNDTIWPSLLIRSDYGGSSFRATIGMKRDVCSNMQMMRNVSQTTIAIRHDRNFREEFAATIAQFNALTERFDDVHLAAQRLHEHRVEVKEFLSEFYKESRNNIDNALDSIVRRIDRERGLLGVTGGSLLEASLWELANGITGHYQHDTAVGKKLQERDPIANAFRAFDHKKGMKAFDLAFQMAS